SLALRWARIGPLPAEATAAAVLASGLAAAWAVVFLATPRWFPGLVFRPGRWASRAYQALYLSVLADRLTLAAVLAATGVAHVMLPQWQAQLQAAVQDWLSDDPARRAAALRFFTVRVNHGEALDTWAPVLVGQLGYDGRDRGKALDL